jgi:hypothetical protein
MSKKSKILGIIDNQICKELNDIINDIQKNIDL